MMPTPSKTFSLGRDPENEIVIDVPMVSGRHARLWFDSGTGLAWIEDTGSSNGTFLGVSPQRITRSSFAAGDTISLGSHAVSGAWLLARLGVQPKEILTFRGDSMVVGRDPSCDRMIDAAQVSSRHARLFRQSGRVMIEDIGSSNGTTVNGRTISGPTAVSAGDTIGLGTHALTLSIEPVFALKATALREESTVIAALESSVFSTTFRWSIGILLVQAVLLALGIVAIGRMETALFGLGLASVWFGLATSLVDRVIGAIRNVDESRAPRPSEFPWLIGVGAAACLVQCSLAWFIVAMRSQLKAPMASTIELMSLASFVGLALGGLIRSVRLRPIAAFALALIAIGAMGVIANGPISGLMPSRWVFEGLLLLEPNSQAPVANLTSPSGMKACVMALGFMLAGLSASAAFITWGPGSASGSKTSWPEPVGP